jgi:hypothetical protein
MTPVEELPGDPPFGRPYAYASYSDVAAHLSFVSTWTASTRPNASQVHQHIVDAADELDAALAIADYAVPVATAATIAIEQVRAWSAVGAAAHVAAAMPQGANGKHAQGLQDRWEALLINIGNRKRHLPLGRDRGRTRPRYAGRATSTFPIGPDDR